jgi:hypothetical protein
MIVASGRTATLAIGQKTISAGLFPATALGR